MGMEREGGGREGAEQVFQVSSGSGMVYAGVYGEGGVATKKTKRESRNEGMGI